MHFPSRFRASVTRAFAVLAASAALTAPSPAAVDVLDAADRDASVSPAVDFYDFAVGGWRKSHPIPADRTSWGSFDELVRRNELRVRTILGSPDQTLAPVGSERRKIGDFYAACNDVAGIEEQGLGGLQPELRAIAAAGRSALAPLVAHGAQIAAEDAPGVAFGSEQDPKAATSVIASVSQGGLTLPNRDYYLAADARSVEIRRAFTTLLRTSFARLGDDPATAGAEAASVLRIETALARVSKEPGDLRDPYANYHPMSLERLAQAAPGFDWRAYFVALGVAPPAFAHIDVNQPGFAAGFASLTRSESLEAWKSYLRWHDLYAANSALPVAFRNARFAFNAVVYGVKAQPPRQRTCANATDAALGFAVGKIYVAAYFPPTARARARAEIAAIRTTLADDIGHLAWMSPQTRAAALHKLAKLGTFKVGYPSRWRDYSSLRIARGDYLGDVLAANRFAFVRDARKIGKPLDRSEWGLTPQTVNAYYDPSMNEIVVPAGILEKPFFDPEADDAVNFGGIGVVIGHEMTHGYDDEGSDFDGDGNLNPIVTKADAVRFHARVACIVNQLAAYKSSVGPRLNGRLDAGEATADLGGLTLSYRAMEAAFAKTGRPAPLGGFTAEQRFYLAYAELWRENQRPQAERAQILGDPHPIARYRVDGTVADAPAFDLAFHVKPGDPMYRPPAKRCAIW